MKRYIIVFILFCTVVTFSQERRYFDTPMGGGGGYVPGWYIYNLEPINQQLKIIGIPELSESGFYSSGGAGFIYLMFIPHLRIGGMGFGGSTSESALHTDGITQKEAVYSFGGGGLTIEYTLPFIKSIGVSVGAILGGAYQKLELYKNSGTFDWNNLWNEFEANAGSDRYSRVLENNYWILSPTLNIDIPFYRFFIFRIGAGYNLSLGNEWTVENEKEILQVPSDLNGDGFFVQSGIFIGFFSF